MAAAKKSPAKKPAAGKTAFAYNAAVDKGRRQAPATRVKHEDIILTPVLRKKLNATAQDQLRNHALIAWMVRKHLDYTSMFHVSIRTGIDPVDVLLNRIFRWHGAPRNFDIAGRLGRDEGFRLLEMEKVVSGDGGFIKLPGIKLQGLESDLIAKASPAQGKSSDSLRKELKSVNNAGLIVDPSTGERLRFSICNRGSGGDQIVFDHFEDAANVIFDGYWSRLTSQWRGVSPLSTALNTVQDISEAFEFNLIKAKMHALFGIALTRKSGVDGDLGGASGATSETEEATATATDTHLELNPTRPIMLDLDEGADVKILESGTPSTEFVEGSYLFIQIAMLALDIPITCFDSRRSSFSARIADLNEYEVSVSSKRTKNRYVRQEYSDWVLESIWNDAKSAWPLRSVAAAAGMSLRDVQEAVEWVPAGSPWLDKLKQVQGDRLAMEAMLDNPIDAARRRGQNVFENIDKTKLVMDYAAANGVPINVSNKDARSIDEIIADADAQTKAEEAGA